MKRIQRPAPFSEEAARMGEELRNARLFLGVSVEDMAAHLRIRRTYLLALEEGRMQDLPGLAYAVGFVRSYARAHGLDADDMVRRFRDMTGPANLHKTDLVFPEPVPERGVPAGAVIMLGAVLAVGAYAGWYHWSGSGTRVVDSVPPLPPNLEQAVLEGSRIRPEVIVGQDAVAESAPPARPDPEIMPATASSAFAAAASADSASPAEDAPVAAVVATVADPLVPPIPLVTPAPGQARSAQAATIPASPAPMVVAPPAPPLPAPPRAEPQREGPRMVLRARGESWVHIRDPRTGQVLLNRLLRGGETFSVPDRQGLVLTTGKAENLDVIVDGEPSAVLENATGVRRDIPLEPEALKAAGVSRQAQAIQR